MAALTTPHSGYHWRGGSHRFFEGWYLRLSLPQLGQAVAFMYSIDDPAGGAPHSGGAAQILGPDDAYCCRTFPDVSRFWAWRDRNGLGHSRSGPLGHRENFLAAAGEGYQVTPTRHQGRLQDPATGQEITWDYSIQPVYGWGPPDRPQRPTAGWLSYLPITEPGWQVLMAHGLATGYLQWGAQRYEFDQAPAYAEKNWGGAFPSRWFWLQANAFEGTPDLTVTAAGGRRQIGPRQEEVAIAAVHHRGCFYEFLSTKGQLVWQVSPWGRWSLQGETHRHRITLTGDTEKAGVWVRVPTQTGLRFLCRDTARGRLHLKLTDRRSGRDIVSADTRLAGLEVGGPPEVASPWGRPL